MSIFGKKHSQSPYQDCDHWSERDRQIVTEDQHRLDALCKLLGVAFSYNLDRYRIEAHFIDQTKEPKK
jgi:hypothetical protein